MNGDGLPALDGTIPARGLQLWRMSWMWSLKVYRHPSLWPAHLLAPLAVAYVALSPMLLAMPAPGPLAGLVALGVLGLLLPLNAGAMWLVVRTGGARRRESFLLVDEHGHAAALMTARLTNHHGRTSLTLENHVARAAPEGVTPYGRQLRRLMAERLLPWLDRQPAGELRIDTTSRQVAGLYLHDFPGLFRSRRTWYGTHQLYRPPGGIDPAITDGDLPDMPGTVRLDQAGGASRFLATASRRFLWRLMISPPGLFVCVLVLVLCVAPFVPQAEAGETSTRPPWIAVVVLVLLLVTGVVIETWRSLHPSPSSGRTYVLPEDGRAAAAVTVSIRRSARGPHVYVSGHFAVPARSRPRHLRPGARLRQMLPEHLTPVLDRHRVPLQLLARPVLARRYLEEFPGLRDVDRKWLLWRVLRYDPTVAGE